MELLRDAEKNASALKVKDEMVFQLLNERDALLKQHESAAKEIEEIGKASGEEIEEWIE